MFAVTTVGGLPPTPETTALEDERRRRRTHHTKPKKTPLHRPRTQEKEKGSGNGSIAARQEHRVDTRERTTTSNADDEEEEEEDAKKKEKEDDRFDPAVRGDDRLLPSDEKRMRTRTRVGAAGKREAMEDTDGLRRGPNTKARLRGGAKTELLRTNAISLPTTTTTTTPEEEERAQTYGGSAGGFPPPQLPLSVPIVDDQTQQFYVCVCEGTRRQRRSGGMRTPALLPPPCR